MSTLQKIVLWVSITLAVNAWVGYALVRFALWG